MFKLTKKADYGLMAVKHLAQIKQDQSASAKEISESYDIPLPLLSKVLQKLAKEGLLTSEQGANGGYRLAQKPGRISALEVIRTLEGPIMLTSCSTARSDCDQSEKCNVREPLRRVHEGIVRLLASISISDLSEEAGPDTCLWSGSPVHKCRAPLPGHRDVEEIR